MCISNVHCLGFSLISVTEYFIYVCINLCSCVYITAELYPPSLIAQLGFPDSLVGEESTCNAGTPV